MNVPLWPEPLRPGDPRQAGAYRLEGRLGGGGMGQVFLGRSPGGRPVAVKLVRPDLADDPGFRRRFALEAEAARRVGGFYTAQLVDADPDADPPWLVTAYIPGPSLHQAVEAHGPMPAEAITVLGAGLAEGLGAIHACDLVHRDLKPSNVILAADGPRVIDFGITRAVDATSHTLSRAVVGTPSFMSPEQARGREIGPPSDVFSLGLVLAFTATGRSPFGTGQAEAIVYRIAHDEPDLTGLTAHLTDLVKRCLAKDPGERPSVADILKELTDPTQTTTQWLPPPFATMIAERHVQTPPAPAPFPSSDPGTHKGRTRDDPDHGRALDTPGDTEQHPYEPGHRAPSGSDMLTSRRRLPRRLFLLGGLAALGAAAVPIGWNFWSHRNRLTDKDSYTVAFSPDGRTIAGGNIHGDGWLWAIDSHEVIADFSSENSPNSAMAFTPDGSALVTAGMKVPLSFRNPSTGKVKHSLSSPVGGAQTMAFSADGTQLVVAGNIPVGNLEAPEICVVWDVAAKEQKHKLPFATKASSQVNSAAFVDGGDSVLLAGEDLTEADGTDGFWRWNLDSGDLKPIGPDGYGSAVAISPNGKQYALGGAHGCSLTSGHGTGLHTISDAEVDALAFSPDGATLAVADKDGIRLWDAATGRADATVTDRRAAALAFHPDATFLVSGGWFVDAEGCWLWPVEDT
ncbi:WD40 repeat domain-containing serine/threonine protein kinase [Streptosporangium sp. NBC_01756]|uniref:WD40 repeat domain-containing serine/threonine protein kinase n=1 Tax=Streptosporangium sp. NBC_01756 TaxID=2975950 RepID=UPI002DD80A5F|nr:serine/threonine-protein kinase [Streptosporangium sp. NBC_01756]WSC86370.1 serine/threonine-protein kinase [Streptosporangium sp. NBC_01756]